MMKNILTLSLLAICLMTLTGRADDQSSIDYSEAMMALIRAWVGGTYDNSVQLAEHEGSDSSKGEQSQPLHQISKPVTIDGFDGLTFFQQLSLDGTNSTIVQMQIDHYMPDPETGTVKLRLHLFRDESQYIDSHLDPSKLAELTLSDVYSVEGCDFYFTANEERTRLEGVMKEEPGCYPVSQRTGEKVHHVDDLVIKPGEYWNKPVMYDADGEFLYGNRDGVYTKMVRIVP